MRGTFWGSWDLCVGRSPRWETGMRKLTSRGIREEVLSGEWNACSLRLQNLRNWSLVIFRSVWLGTINARLYRYDSLLFYSVCIPFIGQWDGGLQPIYSTVNKSSRILTQFYRPGNNPTLKHRLVNASRTFPNYVIGPYPQERDREKAEKQEEKFPSGLTNPRSSR